MSVLFVSSNMLPDQSANATRILSLAKLFKLCGEEPILLGVKYASDIQSEGICDGIKYIHADASDYYTIPKYKRTKFVTSLVTDKLYNIWNETQFKIIVVSGFDRQSISFILKFAKKKNICVVINSVEWYEKNNEVFDGISGKLKFIYNRYGMMVEHVKARNIIGISSLLTSYYDKKNCNTVRIPTIVDKNRYEFVEKNNNSKTIITYAGSPARKDYIGNAIKALALLDENQRKKIEFHIYGTEYENLSVVGVEAALCESLKDSLFVHGRIPHKQVYEKISTADFTVLLRPNKKYANAGFPTKVGESMVCGTPVIANHTSDLKLYIKDNVNGIVLNDETIASCAEGFKKALSINAETLQCMRKQARKQAEESFSYDSYVEQMKEFIKNLKYCK